MTWRSLLYVPANSRRFLDKAQTRGADALILDLEDSVPDDRKQEARDLLTDLWPTLAAGPSDLIVRINGGLRDTARDIEAVVRPGLRALYVAKAESAGTLAWLSAALAEIEAERGMAPGSVGLVPLIETPGALEAAFSLARAPRVVALTLGSEDLATACGMVPTPEALAFARQRIVMAARNAGVTPLGLLDSAAALDHAPDLVRRSRDFGFRGAAVVHPAAIPALNEGFLPDAAEVAWARAVMRALAAAEAEGRGAARLDGRMVDRPLRLRAEEILAAVGRPDAPG
jgi:citrate lyase subunit beta / citryl-CoA lyase